MARDEFVFEKLAELGLDTSLGFVREMLDLDKYLKIPTKVEKRLSRAAQKDLLQIDDDIEVAMDFMLLLVSSLSDTWLRSFNTNDLREKQGYKKLCARIMAKKLQYNGKESSKYKRALELLIRLGIIEEGWKHSDAHNRCKEYRLHPRYFGKGIISYPIKTPTVLKKHSPSVQEAIKRAVSTHIGKNSLVMRKRVTLPETRDVEEHLLLAVKNGYHNKKRKRLVRLGKHSKKEYPESHYVYVEDYIKRYEYLRDHMIIPIVSENLAEERIIDCFNMMPSLIRELLTVDGQSFVELDFACLHPNIVQVLYGAEKPEPITHELVAQRLYNISPENEDFFKKRKEVKIEHLSFFNKDWNGMMRSPLFKYYDKKENMMINRIGMEKEQHGYNITAKELFKAETQLMEEIVGKLNKQGIYVLYVFDALYALEKDVEIVKKTMNEVAAGHGYLTRAA